MIAVPAPSLFFSYKPLLPVLATAPIIFFKKTDNKARHRGFTKKERTIFECVACLVVFKSLCEQLH